jgi:hypothetical protein
MEYAKFDLLCLDNSLPETVTQSFQQLSMPRGKRILIQFFGINPPECLGSVQHRFCSSILQPAEIAVEYDPVSGITVSDYRYFFQPPDGKFRFLIIFPQQSALWRFPFL